MLYGTDWAAAPIAGRAAPLALLDDAITRAARGEPGAIFVHGEAGVGKTRLALAAADRARERGFEVLWGRCVRFGAVESVLMPWVVALEGWLETAHTTERRAVLDGVPGAGQLLPSLGEGRAEDPAWLLSVAESLVARVVSLRPTLLVMDDIQWADAASRDALAYLIAGFGGQRELVLATYRDEGLPPGDPLFGWLADVRRMPSVVEAALGRLDRGETERQIASLLGGSPSARLVDDVVRTSDGNPYLTELLVQSVSADADGLPAGVPDDLATALMAAWHRLSTPAREAVRILAVAGRPSPVARWVDACVANGVDPFEMRAALHEATANGIVVRVGADSVWLRHPLLAEVLYDTYLPGEAAPVHRAWARGLATTSASGAEEVRRLGDLALHYERAGLVDEAFTCSVQAADGSRDARLWREEPVHLRRAARLWSGAGDGVKGSLDEVDLLERAAVAGMRVGDIREGLEAGRRALELARADRDPRRTSRLMRWCAETAWWLGDLHEEPIDVSRAAVALVRSHPDSQEYAQALSSLAENHVFRGERAKAAHIADEAVAAARRSGSAAALGAALGIRAFATRFDAETGRAEADSVEALSWAESAQDPDGLQWAAQWRINVLLTRGRLRHAAKVAEAALASALESGALGAAAWHAGDLAAQLTEMGRLADATKVVRVGLSLTGVGNGTAEVRLSAMRLATRRGDLAAAEQHLARAREQIPRLEYRPGLEAPPVLAECLIARRRPGEALSLLRRTLWATNDPQDLVLMFLYAARAAADLAEVRRDQGDQTGVRAVRRALRDFIRAADRINFGPLDDSLPDDPLRAAWRAVRDAEVRRCTAGVVPPDLWERAARSCKAAALGWEEQRANRGWAVALLAAGASRSEAAAPLREAYRYARREGAMQLLRDIEAWAKAHRLSLDEPVEGAVVPRQRQHPPGRLSSLTQREQEVLAHLVAGHTYAEIASALFVTEKTVSSHVSHLLRKTGTSSRREVSALALRLTEEDADHSRGYAS